MDAWSAARGPRSFDGLAETSDRGFISGMGNWAHVTLYIWLFAFAGNAAAENPALPPGFKKNFSNCSVPSIRAAEIYDNCIVDKLPPNANNTLIVSTKNSCKRIACNPSMWERFLY